MKKTADWRITHRPKIYLAILECLKKTQLDEQDFIRFNSVLAEKLELIFGSAHATEFKHGAYAEYLSLTKNKASTATVVSEVDKTHLSVDFLTTFFTLQYYLDQVYDRHLKVDFVQDWRDCSLKVGNDMVDALIQLATGKESGLNYTMEDIAELMSTSSQVLINPNMIQRLIKVHGDYGFNAGIIYLELKEMADEIALMPANKLPPNYSPYTDKSPVNAYLGSLTYNLSDSDHEGSHHSSVIVYVDVNIHQFSGGQINNLIFKAIEEDEDFEWLTESSVITDINFSIQRAIDSDKLLEAHRESEHYAVHISPQIVEQHSAGLKKA